MSVLLSMQRAILDAVTPGLRGVAVRWGEQFVDARFMFDHIADDDELEDVSLAETSMIADFADDVEVSFVALCVPTAAPREPVAGEEWVYLRKEP